jgi:hypothetical protein
MSATTHSTSRGARRRIKKSRFDGLHPGCAHILLLAGCVDSPYGPIDVSRQLPQVPSGNRRDQGSAPASPFPAGWSCSNRLCLRNHGKNPRAKPFGRRPTGNVTPSLCALERHGRVQPRTPIHGLDQALLALHPSANRSSITLAKYISLLPRKEGGNLYTNQEGTTEV